MLRDDDISINPASGERLRWHVRSSDTDGRMVRLELWCAPGGGVPSLHVHPRSEERFEVLAGRLRVQLGDRVLTAGAGEHLTLPAGIPHKWLVDGDEEAHVFVEVDAPGAFEEQIETLFALGRRGVARRGGELPPLAVACVVRGHMEDGHLASPLPLAAQRAMVEVLAGVARLTGVAREVDAARAEARERLARTATRTLVAG